MADEIPVLVTVTGTDEDNDQITLTTCGVLSDISDGFALRYEETSSDDLRPTQTLVECRKEGVSVVRADGVVSMVVYRENETFVSDYETPVGKFTLRVFTTEVSVRRREAMGHVALAYQVSLSSALSAEGETAMRWLDIRFKPCKK